MARRHFPCGINILIHGHTLLKITLAALFNSILKMKWSRFDSNRRAYSWDWDFSFWHETEWFSQIIVYSQKDVFSFECFRKSVMAIGKICNDTLWDRKMCITAHFYCLYFPSLLGINNGNQCHVLHNRLPALMPSWGKRKKKKRKKT